MSDFSALIDLPQRRGVPCGLKTNKQKKQKRDHATLPFFNLKSNRQHHSRVILTLVKHSLERDLWKELVDPS